MPQPERLSAASHLFTVRLWREDPGGGLVEWRGQAMHVLSGEARWFREWAEMVDDLAAMAWQQEQTVGASHSSEIAG